MSMSTTETIGFCNQLIQLLQDNQTDLQQKGLDVSSWITELTMLNNDTIAQDATHDNMRVAFKEQTKKAQDSANLTYKTTSTKLDAVIGVLGKDTLLAKQAARLRSSIIKQKKKKRLKRLKAKAFQTFQSIFITFLTVKNCLAMLPDSFSRFKI